jgi:transposase
MVPSAFRVYAYPAPVDLRLAYEGLSELAGKHLARVAVGACFLFVNGSRTRAKVLHVDGTGTCIYAKRLDGGKQFPQLWSDDADAAHPGAPLRLSMRELTTFIRQTPVQAAATRALVLVSARGERTTRRAPSRRRRQRAA